MRRLQILKKTQGIILIISSKYSNSNPTIDDLKSEVNNFQNYNYDIFKQRNKNISDNILKSKQSGNDEKVEISSKTLDKLKSLIEEDEKVKENYKNPNTNTEEFQEVEENFEVKEVIVNRPLKNFVWGLGQQTKQKKCIIYF